MPTPATRSPSTRCSWASQFAGPAAVSVYNAQLLAGARERTERLQRALESRAVIDQAIGIIRSRSGVSAEEAFDRLTREPDREHQAPRRCRAAGRGGGAARHGRDSGPRRCGRENSDIAASSAGRDVPLGHQPPGHVGQVLAVGARVVAAAAGRPARRRRRGFRAGSPWPVRRGRGWSARSAAAASRSRAWARVPAVSRRTRCGQGFVRQGDRRR